MNKRHYFDHALKAWNAGARAIRSSTLDFLIGLGQCKDTACIEEIPQEIVDEIERQFIDFDWSLLSAVSFVESVCASDVEAYEDLLKKRQIWYNEGIVFYFENTGRSDVIKIRQYNELEVKAHEVFGAVGMVRAVLEELERKNHESGLQYWQNELNQALSRRDDFIRSNEYKQLDPAFCADIEQRSYERAVAKHNEEDA